jgi:hypothetical protein
VPRAIAVSLLMVVAGCPRVDRLEDADPTSAPRADEERERRAIQASAAGYVDALAARDPASAASWVTSNTFAFYDRLRALALTGDRDELERHDVMEIVMVLELRSRFTRAQLEQTDGRKLFDEAVAAGMAAGSFPLDDVWIDEAAGRAEVRVDGNPVVWLAREQGRWLVDIPAAIADLAPMIEAELAEPISADGKLRAAFTLLEVERDTPHGLDIAILDGPLDVVP